MGVIIRLKEATDISERLHRNNKTVVLVGGCFDILHLGHLHFLERAKRAGDILLVALENDETIRRLKGGKRPINLQKDRAQILSMLRIVDGVILLPPMKTHADYFSLVKNLKPDIIAVTAGDPQLKQKKEQAKMVDGKVKIVTPYLKTASTSGLVKILGID